MRKPALLAVFVTLAAAIPASRAEPIWVSNLGETIHYAHGTADFRFFYANSFTTGPRLMYRPPYVTNRVRNTSDDPFSVPVYLFDDNAGEPGTILETVDSHTIPANTAKDISRYSAIHPTLVPFTQVP